MTRVWTDALIPPLANALRGREWRRVDESRDGGWLAEEDAPGRGWFWLADGTDTFVRLSPFEDPRLPHVPSMIADWLRAGASVQILAHRFESRMVCRVARDGDLRIAKLYRHLDAQELRWSQLARHTGSAAWRVPRVLASDAVNKLLMIEHCRGATLHDDWLHGKGRVEDGELLRSLLEWLAHASVPTDFPRHTPSDEQHILQQELGRCERTIAVPTAGLRELVDEVCGRLADQPVADWVITHRDLHDKQILRDGDRGTLIDLDLCAAAPAGLDRGNVLAHTRLRALQGATLPWREIAARVIDPAATRDQRHANALWTGATLTRLALIYGRRAHRGSLITELVHSAHDALRRRGEWSDIL